MSEERYPIKPYRGLESTINDADHEYGEILITKDTHKIFWSDGTSLHELAYTQLITDVENDLSGHINDSTIHFEKGEIVLNDLSGVSITTPANNQLLRYNNGAWENWTHDFAAASNLHNALTITGDSRYLSLNSGTQVLTVNTVDISNSNHVTGTLPIASGGTSRTSLTSGKVLVGNGTSGILTPSNLHWNDSLNRLGVNVSSPTVALDVGGDINASGVITDVSGNSGQWNEAYDWGDHGDEGYLTTETDPIFVASPAYDITSTQITNWDTAYGWGDHSGLYISENETITLTGDVTGSGKTSIATVITNNAVTTSKILNANVTYAKIQNVAANRLLGRVSTSGTIQEIQLGPNLAFDGTTLNVELEETNMFYSNGNVGIGQETPAYTLDVLGDINFTGELYQNDVALNISGWDAAYSWGDHNQGGYLQASDFTEHVVYDITAGDISGWTNASNLAHPAADITGSGGYLSFNAGTQVLTVNQVDISDTTHVTGTLPVTQGGTNRTTLDANKVLVGDGTGSIISSGLHWDNVNNRLGVNKTPTTALDISGTVTISGSGTSINATGNISAGSFSGTGATITDIEINNITQIDTSSPSSGQLLTFNGTNWVNQTHDFADSTSLHPAVSLTTSRSYLSLNASTQELTATHVHIINDTTGTLNVARGGTGRTSLTSGKILVGAGTGAVLMPTGLHWNDTSKRLGVNQGSPGYTLDVSGELRTTSDIYAQGDIGVGKLSPEERLDVVGNIQLSGNLKFASSSTNRIDFDHNSASCGRIGYAAGTADGKDIDIYAADGTGAVGGNVNILAGLGAGYGNVAIVGETIHLSNNYTNGKVGINISSPDYALDVFGDIRASGCFRGDGSLLTDIDHTNLLNVGNNTHSQIDSHISDSTIHFTKDSILLNDLSGVSITSPSSSHVLRYNGTIWVNAKLNLSDSTGTITDTQHGNRGGGALHALVTTSAHGFMSSTDKTKLNGIESGAQVNTVTSVADKTGAVTLDKDDVGLNNVDNVQQMPLSYLSTATNLGGGSASNSLVPSQLAAKTYIDSEITNVLSSSDAMVFKGTIDASTDPDYPSGNTGDTYKFSVGGKIGGSSGEDVEVGDMLICLSTNAGGTHATVGSDWSVIQTNIEGYVLGPSSSINDRIALFDGTSGSLIKQSSVGISSVVLTSRTLTAGNGLTGGGALSSNLTFTLGTPGTISGISTNNVSTSSHTHAISSDHIPSDSTSVLLAAKGLFDHVQSNTTDHDAVYIRIDEFDGGEW